jgi:hypothetical protein
MLDLPEIGKEVRAFMRGSLDAQPQDEEFNRLALEIFAFQRAENLAYAKLAKNIGEVKQWQEIPAVPTTAFKQLELTALAPEARSAVFYSSGTTQPDRSRHFHSPQSLAIYEESLWLWFENIFAFAKGDAKWLFLTPTAEEAPNSSLAHMFSTIARRVKRDYVQFAGQFDRDGAWSLDSRSVLNFSSLAEGSKGPVAILGTAFLFVHLLDALEIAGTKIRLPEGSWVMETGGYKGRSREIPKDELHGLLRERLGVSKIFGEYGMSELSSQAYAGADGLFRFPPWARVRLISPATGREAREGERGLIRVYDLANVWSVMAVQTEDVGIKMGDAFRLVGRATEAEARGCSLMSV